MPVQMPQSERSIPDTLDAATVAEIDDRLATVAASEQVRILFAIESGSRAWGFPSPDSDYDCRFVYLRRQHDYLALFPRRDVIETPLTPVLDVNGWDLAKALKLLLGGNAVIIEWLTSPIVYQAVPGFRERFTRLADEIADRSRIAHHYVHLARRQVTLTLAEPDNAPLKKLFYALRPAIALRWLRQRPQARVAPMHFPTLCAQSDLSPSLQESIERLLMEKAKTRELGSGPVPPDIRDIITSELSLAESAFDRPTRPPAEVIEKAEEFFRQSVTQLAAGAQR